jgi:hypothetical protein
MIGDFYTGAYGPTIVLAMTSLVACDWLMQLFRELAEHGGPRNLTDGPEVRVGNVNAISMVRRSTGPLVALRRQGDDIHSFVWSATEDGWLHSRDLVQALREAGSGHQYMNDNKDDVALVELSLGEPDLLGSVRRSLEE